MIIRYYLFITIILFSSCISTNKEVNPFYSGEAIVTNCCDTFFLKRCQALNYNDSLLLKLDDALITRSDYEIEILKIKNEYFAKCRLTYGVTDCTWRAPVFKNIYLDIQLDKDIYNRGDSLRGQMNLIFSSKQTMADTTILDTIKVNGLIKTIVQ
jgi:hypothetical protein